MSAFESFRRAAALPARISATRLQRMRVYRHLAHRRKRTCYRRFTHIGCAQTNQSSTSSVANRTGKQQARCGTATILALNKRLGFPRSGWPDIREGPHASNRFHRFQFQRAQGPIKGQKARNMSLLRAFIREQARVEQKIEYDIGNYRDLLVRSYGWENLLLTL
ncbi:MAG: hypothetical protein QOJ99_1944 [Bryobacterales bacterium]|nr:hypothetical protein [Bryobacterales bacterium]